MGIGENVGEGVGCNVGSSGFTSAPTEAPADYFVDPVLGNDSNNGTSTSTPWQHLPGTRNTGDTAFLSANSVAAGDIIEIKAGSTFTSATCGRVLMDNTRYPTNGDENNRIIIRKSSTWGTGDITYDGTGMTCPGSWGLISVNSVHYITFNDLIVRDSPAWAFLINVSSHHIICDGLRITNNSKGLAFFQNEATAKYNIVRNCEVDNNSTGGIVIYQGLGGYYLIENNTVYNNSTSLANYDGIQCGSADGGAHHVVIQNNNTYNNGAGGGADNLDCGGHGTQHHYLLQDNIIGPGGGLLKCHSGETYCQGTYESGVDGFHIVRRNTSHSMYTCYAFHDPIVIYNNTFVDAGSSFRIYNAMPSVCSYTGTVTVGDSALWSSDSDYGRMCFKNNIFWNEDDVITDQMPQALEQGGTLLVDWSSLKGSYNLWKWGQNMRIKWSDQYVYYGSEIGCGVGSVFESWQQSMTPNLEPNSVCQAWNTNVSTMFTDYNNDDFTLATNSPAEDSGSALTYATNSGSSSTTLTVDRASYFCDGYGGLIEADTIDVGGTEVLISSINDTTNTITLATAISWSTDDPVTLPYTGTAPNIGRY